MTVMYNVFDHFVVSKKVIYSITLVYMHSGGCSDCFILISGRLSAFSFFSTMSTTVSSYIMTPATRFKRALLLTIGPMLR